MRERVRNRSRTGYTCAAIGPINAYLGNIIPNESVRVRQIFPVVQTFID